MTDPKADASGAPTAAPTATRRIWKRILSLVFLGATAALVIVQLTKAIRHDVQLEFELADSLAEQLNKVELMAFFEEDSGKPFSVAIYHFDEGMRPPNPLRHSLQLPNGRYLIIAQLYRNGQPMPIQARRDLEVIGDVHLRYRLP